LHFVIREIRWKCGSPFQQNTAQTSFMWIPHIWKTEKWLGVLDLSAYNIAKDHNQEIQFLSYTNVPKFFLPT